MGHASVMGKSPKPMDTCVCTGDLTQNFLAAIQLPYQGRVQKT